MTASIRKFKVKFPEKWKDFAAQCKVTDFLQGNDGKRIVAEFHGKLRQWNGSRFRESFENAVDDFVEQSTSYWLNDSERLRKAFQSLDNNVLVCLCNHMSKTDAITNVAICIFWILHKQNAEV